MATNPPVVLIHGLDRPPFLMGHSYGGLLMQLLLDRGLGAAGVAIDSAPPQGIRKVPPAQLKALFPAFENPANRHRAVPFTPKQFHYAFCNTLSEEKSAEVYERYHVAAPGRFIWDGFLANVGPSRRRTRTTRSSRAAATTRWASRAGRRLPTARSTGATSTGRGVLSYGVRSEWA